MIDARRESILMFMHEKGYLKPMKRVPKPKSEGEEAFALHCRAERIKVIREYTFHPSRKWRFDFVIADTEHKIAVEIEGTMIGGSLHQRTGGYENDCRKYAEAALLGWTVFRFTKGMVLSGEAINYILQALGKDPRL